MQNTKPVIKKLNQDSGLWYVTLLCRVSKHFLTSQRIVVPLSSRLSSHRRITVQEDTVYYAGTGDEGSKPVG
jgi:hypothetical protein